MNISHVLLFLLSLAPALLTGFNISLLISQGRKQWKNMNPLVLVIAFIVFFHSCWQVSFFLDESYYLFIPFPQDWFSHTYFFLIPCLLGLLTIPKIHPGLSKYYYISLILSVILSVLGIFAFKGKDLIWFSSSLSILLVFVGLKEDQFGLFYRYFVKYLFLENTWIALFYFHSTSLFFIGLLLQLAARFYLFHYLNLFWVSGFLKNHINNKELA